MLARCHFSVLFSEDRFVEECQRGTRRALFHFITSFLSFRSTLEYLIRHLRRISSRHAETGMTSRNLAIVWTPNLVNQHNHHHHHHPAEVEDGERLQTGLVRDTKAVQYLIDYAPWIFGDERNGEL